MEGLNEVYCLGVGKGPAQCTTVPELCIILFGLVFYIDQHPAARPMKQAVRKVAALAEITRLNTHVPTNKLTLRA
jgi:hypothetical protein